MSEYKAVRIVGTEDGWMKDEWLVRKWHMIQHKLLKYGK